MIPACNDGGSTATGGTGGTVGAAGAQSQGGNYSAGGTSAASGGTTSAPVAGATSVAKSGQIEIASFSKDNLDRFVSAQFAASAPTNTCSAHAFGDCVFSSNCSDPAVNTVFVSAGSINLTCTSPALNVTLQPGANNEYTTQLLTSSFGGAEALHLSAVGATVPAFSTDVTMPKVLLVDSPVADATGIIAAPVTSDLTISFSRGATDVSMIASGSSNAGGISCEVASTTGTITIPAAALAAIGAGVDLQLITAKLTAIADADWNINVWTAMPAYTSNLANPVTIHVQ